MKKIQINKINRKDITTSNIVDYIIQEKRKLVGKSLKMLDGQQFHWSKREWIALKYIVAIFGGQLEEGITFMGTKHYLQKI